MILVTGATGNLGAHLLFKLLTLNKNVVALKRNNSNIQNVKRIFSFYSKTPELIFNKIKWINADITDFVSLNDAFDDIDTVYHCAAIISLGNKNYFKSYDTNVKGTANIVNLCLQHKVKKLCHVSSIAAIGINENGLTSENDLLNPEETSSFYSLTKYYGEMEVWRGIEEGLNAVIVNPSVILAPYPLNKTASFFLNFFINRKINYYTCGKKGYIDVNDLADIMIKLTESPIVNERFIVSNENLSFKQIIDFVNIYINKPLAYKKVSKYKLYFLRYILALLTLGRSPLTKQTIHYLLTDDIYSNKKLTDSIDFKFTSAKDSIFNILNIYTKNKI